MIRRFLCSSRAGATGISAVAMAAGGTTLVSDRIVTGRPVRCPEGRRRCGDRGGTLGLKQHRLLLDAMTLQEFVDDPEAGAVTEEDVPVGHNHV